MNKIEYDILRKLNDPSKKTAETKGFPKLFSGGEFLIKKPVIDQVGTSTSEPEVVKNSYIVMERLGKTL